MELSLIIFGVGSAYQDSFLKYFMHSMLYHQRQNWFAFLLPILVCSLLGTLKQESNVLVPWRAITYVVVLYRLLCGAFREEEILGGWHLMCCFKGALECLLKRVTGPSTMRSKKMTWRAIRRRRITKDKSPPPPHRPTLSLSFN